MEEVTGEDDPRAQIERLESRIEELAVRLESCRKFALAARIAMTLGAALLVALAIGAIQPNALAFTGAVAALLGGIVLAGSNRSTAHEAAEQMAAAERERAALIGLIELRTVDAPATLH